MDRQMDMVVNRLPEPTWNRLNMNETKLSGIIIPAEAVYQIQTAENTVVRKLEADASETESGSENAVETSSQVGNDTKESKNLWDSIETGMGEDISVLGKEIVPNLFTVLTDSPNHFGVPTKTDEAAVANNNEIINSEKDVTVITIEDNGDSAFCSFLIHANEGTDSHFAFVCKSTAANGSAPESDTANVNAPKPDSANDIKCHSTKDSGGTLTVQVKVIAEKDAIVHISCVQVLDNQATGMFDIGGLCKENARIELTRLELGAAKQYTGCCIALDGDLSSFSSDIGYMERGNQTLDMNYIARHYGRHTVSRMDVTGVLRDNAFKTFRGTIDFVSGCLGAKGDEQEDVLMLGDDVVNQTVPLILCAEEDVEGNHGATIGELDERTLFYLASRGIERDSAEQMIARSRIEAVSDLLPIQDLKSLAESRL